MTFASAAPSAASALPLAVVVDDILAAQISWEDAVAGDILQICAICRAKGAEVASRPVGTSSQKQPPLFQCAMLAQHSLEPGPVLHGPSVSLAPSTHRLSAMSSSAANDVGSRDAGARIARSSHNNRANVRASGAAATAPRTADISLVRAATRCL